MNRSGNKQIELNNESVSISFSFDVSNINLVNSLLEKIKSAASEAGVGVVDDDETSFDGSDCCIFMRSPNVDKLLEVVEPLLEENDFISDLYYEVTYDYKNGPSLKGDEIVHLDVHPTVEKRGDAYQMLSVWGKNGDMYCDINFNSLSSVDSDNAAMWGFILGEVTQHLANALMDKHGIDIETSLDLIAKNCARQAVFCGIRIDHHVSHNEETDGDTYHGYS
jgi:hypothetical protein